MQYCHMLEQFYFYTSEMCTLLFDKINDPVVLTEADLQYIQLVF